MPQPSVQDVHVATSLTNIAVAYFQGQDAYVADKVFPIVPVQHQTDVYFVWSKVSSGRKRTFFATRRNSAPTRPNLRGPAST